MEKNSLKPTCRMLVIGGSAGSLDALLEIVPLLKPTISIPIVLVLHRKNSTEVMLTELITAKTKLAVKEIEDKELIQNSTVYIVPGDYHLLIEKSGHFSLDFSEKINFSRPSIDVTFESASLVYGPELACIVLSGANTDGSEGARIVKERGGVVIAQRPDTAVVSIMPEATIEHAQPQYVFDIQEMVDYINLL
ncbi:MAG TPA: chemotaxis protein CheB [Bacteroidia bacterium]|nr:chemotaxis protein CheB [Bacteroidia bacterium]